MKILGEALAFALNIYLFIYLLMFCSHVKAKSVLLVNFGQRNDKTVATEECSLVVLFAVKNFVLS